MPTKLKRVDALVLVGDINRGTERMVSDWVVQAESQNSSELFIQISSPGGKLEAAFGIYDCLRSSSIPVTTLNMGNVESAAVLIYLAGDKRLVTPTGLFMVHALGHSLDGLVTKASAGALIECLTNNIQRYGDIFKDRTKLSKDIFDIDECLCGGERYINAVQAGLLGLATVTPAEYKVPEGAIWRHIS
jgi:ATP-dependent protease ClpP protease subunit